MKKSTAGGTKSAKGGNKSEKGGPSPEKVKKPRDKSLAKNGSKQIDNASVMEKATEKGDVTPEPVKKQAAGKSVEKQASKRSQQIDKKMASERGSKEELEKKASKLPEEAKEEDEAPAQEENPLVENEAEAEGEQPVQPLEKQESKVSKISKKSKALEKQASKKSQQLEKKASNVQSQGKKQSSHHSRYQQEDGAESVVQQAHEEEGLRSDAGQPDEHDVEMTRGEPSELGANQTVETRGANLADVQGLDKSFAATEKMKPEDEKFYDEAKENLERYTDVDRAQVEKEQQPSDDEGHLGLFDDEEIQPKKLGGIPPETVSLVIESWAKCEKLGLEKVGVVLFKNIFKLAPEALQLFSFKDNKNLYESKELKKHGLAVVTTIGKAVSGLSDLESLIPVLRRLGRQHAARGIVPDHYPVVAKALINTLKAGLKQEFSPSVKQAWENVYKIISDCMIGDHYNDPNLVSDELTQDRIEMVQNSWARVMELGDEAVGSVIFRNLFEVNRKLLKLFSFSHYENYEEEEDYIMHVKKVTGVISKAIEHLGSMEQLIPILKQIGAAHIPRGVKEADYEFLGEAIIMSLREVLHEDFTYPLERAWEVTYLNVKNGVISDNYSTVKNEAGLTPKDIYEAKQCWNKAASLGVNKVGVLLFKNIFTIAPEAAKAFSFGNDPNFMNNKEMEEHGVKVVMAFDHAVRSLDNIHALQETADGLRDTHSFFNLSPEHHVIVKEALLQTLKQGLGDEFTDAQRELWNGIYTAIRNMWVGHDYDQQEDDPHDQDLNILRKRIIQHTWKMCESKSHEAVGKSIFSHIFKIAPQALQLFSAFKDEPNYIESDVFMEHALKVVGALSQAVNNLDLIDSIIPMLKQLGLDHQKRGIKEEHYIVLSKAIACTLEETLGCSWNPTVKQAWRIAIEMVSTTMMSASDEQDPTARDTTGRYDDTMRPMMDEKTKRDQIAAEAQDLEDEKAFIKGNQNPDGVQEVKQHYIGMFRKEVDFHHKVAYRFEKAYRLGKKVNERKQTLNLEIIDCISEHSGYIEQDPLALFYCLFFCIYYKNEDLVEFLRTLIQKIHSHEKIDKLLEFIDVNGIEKIRSVGEQINSLVYHMVFYQAVDDDLRIVYSQIIRQCRFIQLRDKDALQFLNQRDYELIKLSFDRYTTKLNLLLFFKKSFPLKASTYRRYNQAYYEEIVINNSVESRVAQNYRERFLVTAEDIYIVFDMYCKEDYDEQFMKTKKDEITHKQFIDLFITCLKNDSFKIAILIYTLYLNPTVDMDERMMDILMATLKDSVQFHEMKLFFLHEHFDVLSIQQMNQLIDIYQEILLTRKEIKMNPILSQFNTIKISLLIYRICWKIEKKQIYSLITKCSLLQNFLISSLSLYFEKQNNILTLYKFMIEPILHMTERKDSLDVMYEMNMQELLKHPVVVEVLNLVYEGKYSVSSSALSMSQTFQSLLDTEALSLKSINDRLLQNIMNFGDSGNSKQTSLQYNIWKQSIQQREQDEMIFTTIISGIMVVMAILINQSLNVSYDETIINFTTNFAKKTYLLLQAQDTVLLNYCDHQIVNSASILSSLQMFYMLIIFNTFGMITSVIQKIVIFRVKDNVTLNVSQIFIEASIAAVGMLFIISYNSSTVNTMLSDTCRAVIPDITTDQAFAMDKVYTLTNTMDGELDFKYILSVVIIQLCIISVRMLQRTQYLGELIMMLSQMGNELIRFFATFGLIIGLFLLIGRMLSEEFKFERAYFWQAFLDLFNAFNGNQSFAQFTMPTGQIYIGVFMFLFKILLLSLLAAMFINRYKVVWTNLDAFKRFNIIKLKNSLSYDKFLGGVTISFFPINFIILPFILPIVLLRSKRASDFLLKIQYVFMILCYCLIAGIMIVPASPVLYIKMVTNSIFIALTNRRQDYKGQNVIQLIVTVFIGPIFIAISILIDLLSLPNLLLKDSKGFEHKYQQSTDRLNDAQIDVVMFTFAKIFYGQNFQKFKDSHMTLMELMLMHRKIFSLIENLHDLCCRGNKDYKEALAMVQDYNMTKILTRMCSIPDAQGNYKDSKVELNVIYAVQFDIETYNYFDIVLRKLRMGILAQEIKKKQAGKDEEEEDAAAKAEGEQDPDDDDDETKKVDGILAIIIGPDGVPLKRNNSDVMNNFFINFVARSFTDIEKLLAGINQGEVRRKKRFDEEIEKRKKVWEQQTVGQFTDASTKYEQFVKSDLGIKDEKIQKQKTSTLAQQVQGKVANKSSEHKTESTHSGEMAGSIKSKPVSNIKNSKTSKM